MNHIFYKKALALRQNIYGDLHRRTAESYLRMGLVYEKELDHERAVEFISKAVSIRTTLLGHEHPDTVDAINALEALSVKED